MARLLYLQCIQVIARIQYKSVTASPKLLWCPLLLLYSAVVLNLRAHTEGYYGHQGAAAPQVENHWYSVHILYTTGPSKRGHPTRQYKWYQYKSQVANARTHTHLRIYAPTVRCD
jgi:hypothetical protein